MRRRLRLWLAERYPYRYRWLLLNRTTVCDAAMTMRAARRRKSPRAAVVVGAYGWPPGYLRREDGTPWRGARS